MQTLNMDPEEDKIYEWSPAKISGTIITVETVATRRQHHIWLPQKKDTHRCPIHSNLSEGLKNILENMKFT